MERVAEKGIAYHLRTTSGAETKGDGQQKEAETKEETLIGVKRYGGLYCNGCEVSLLKDGEETARYAGKVCADRCPLCETLIEDGKEKGLFVNCSCFEWRIGPHRLNQRNLKNLKVVDSFGEECSVERFLSVIASSSSCPIQFYDRITNN